MASSRKTPTSCERDPRQLWGTNLIHPLAQDVVTRKRGDGKYYFALWQTNNNTPNKMLLSESAVSCLLRVRSVSFTSCAKGCIKFVPHSCPITSLKWNLFSFFIGCCQHYETKTICLYIFLISERYCGTEHQYWFSRFLGVSAKGCIKFVPHSCLVSLSHEVGIVLEGAICYFIYAKFAVMSLKVVHQYGC
jgi:hypothetical protein